MANIKTDDLCRRCAYSTHNNKCFKIPCNECTMYSKTVIESQIFGYTHCKCLSVQLGTECPYFEEATP